MTYSIIGILAAIILLIINRDVLWSHDGKVRTETQNTYRLLLFGIMAYYITDMLWGILEEHKLSSLLYADTVVHFTAMAAAVMFWTQYVVRYLERSDRFAKMLLYAGKAILAFELVVIVINFFSPIMFSVEKDCTYRAGSARYVMLSLQILMYVLASVYTLYVSCRSSGKIKRRHQTIGLFGIIMVLLIFIQVFYPLLPFYAMGYMLGTCLLHSFVVEDEKEEYRSKLEKALDREQMQTEMLSESRTELQEALAEAERANKSKTAFLSNMSHEIRTPMNAIIGLNDLAMTDPTASDSIKEYLRKTGVSARHLLGIINDILDMSRIESGKMFIKSEEFSISECLEQVNTIISGQCKEKDIAYSFQPKCRIDGYYIGDTMKLRQVLINILGNAVKFTDEGGKIEFLVGEIRRCEGKAVMQFVISDNGIGMSEDYLPHIFDAFSQENASFHSKHGSTGIGMPITKSIVELMNGTIEVESEKGKGTTFTVTVTLGISDRQAEEKASDTAANKSPVELKGRRILLAEDVSVNAEIIVMMLKMHMIEVDVAENGRIAVEKFTGQPEGFYDAILMDMRMPEMDGLEAARLIRSCERDDAETVPIIALTANAFEEDVQKSIQAGLNAHLSKPIEPDILLDTLERLIR